MGRNIGAVLVGLIAATVVLMLLETLGHKLYPFPEGIDPKDKAQFIAHFQTLPIGALLYVLVVQAVASLAGGYVTGRIAAPNGNLRLAYILGGILTFFGIINLYTIPHPMWYAVCNILVYIPFVWIGFHLAKSKTS